MEKVLFLEEDAQYIFFGGGGICIGSNVRIGSDARLSVYQQEDQIAKIIIHDNCYIGTHFSIITAGLVEIEQGTLFASYITIIGHNHGINPESNNEYGKQPLNTAPVLIKEGCWIGERVCILSGVTIGKKCIVGAGAVVTKNIPDYCIAVGNPAKVIKQYNLNTHCWEKIS